MLLISLLYNIFGICQYFFVRDISEIDFHSTYKYILFTIHFYYFLYDIINELNFYDRYIYIYHHILTLFQMYLIYYINPTHNTWLKILELYSYLEITSLIVNIRYILKKYNLLNNIIDLQFILIYSWIRGYIFPFIIYNDLSENFYIYFIPTIMYVLSIIWLCKWIYNFVNRLF